MIRQKNITSFILDKDIIINKGELNLYLIKRNSNQLLDRMFLICLNEQTHVHIPAKVTFYQDDYYYELVAEATDVHGVSILNSKGYTDLTKVIIDKIENSYGKTLERNEELKTIFYQTRNFNELLSILLKIDIAHKKYVREQKSNSYQLASREIEEQMHAIALQGSFREPFPKDRDDLLKIEILALKTHVLKIADYYGYDSEALLSDLFINGNDKSLTEYADNLVKSNKCQARKICLSDDFYKQTVTDPIIAFKTKEQNNEGFDNSVPVLLHLNSNGSWYEDYHGEHHDIDESDASSFFKECIAFYYRMPDKVDWAFLIKGLFAKSSSVFYVIFFTLLVWGGLWGLAIPSFVEFLISKIIPYANTVELMQSLELIFFLIIGSVGMKVVMNIAINVFSVDKSERIQIAIFDKILNTSIGNLRKIELGDLSKRIISCLNIRKYIVNFVKMLTFATLGLFSFLSMMIHDSEMSFYMLLPIVIYILCYCYVMVNSLKKYELFYDYKDNLSSTLRQMIDGISKIKITNADRYIISKYMSCYRHMSVMEYIISKNVSTRRLLNNALPLLLCLMFMMFHMCADNSEIPSHLAFFAAFYFCMIGFLGAFLNFWEFVPVKSLYERLKPIIQSDVESDFNTEQLDNFYGNVELSHVFYHYDDSDVEVIKDVSLKVECGDFIVISGASGSGKTSLVELIIGFFVPSKGAVYYDDFDLKLLNKTSVRKHVGVVLQKSQIEEASIMDNILKGTNYGIDEARRVASLVGLTEEIEQMPMGFHTLVNKRNISKGQQQKILIAKALVGNPCLLIMDEATSSLDNISQKLIMDRIAGLNITRIVISNRISTVKSADFIYVMKDGTIESKGTFRELCKTSELFRSLIS